MILTLQILIVIQLTYLYWAYELKNIWINIFTFFSITVCSASFAMESETQSETILIIIDMQPHFISAADSKLIENVSQKINTAIKNKWKIFFVEYSGVEKTDKRLMEICLKADYKDIHIITKDQNDGSAHIKLKLLKLAIKPKKLKICGVNTSLCILSTVKGLIKYLDHSTEIVVLQDACRDDLEKYHIKGLEELLMLSTVKMEGEYEWSEPTCEDHERRNLLLMYTLKQYIY